MRIAPATRLVALLLAAPHSGGASEFLLNGGFESGTFDAWGNSFAHPTGFFGVDDNSTTDLSSSDSPGPFSGSYFAVSDNTGPAAAILWQSFNLPESDSVALSFRMVADSYASVTVGAPDFDHGTTPNQHARVDLLTWTDFQAAPYSTATAINLWTGGTALGPGDDPSAYALHAFDLTSSLGAGGAFVLRFGFVATEDVFNLALDEVSLVAEPSVPPVPEPGHAWTCVLALAGLESARRVRARRRITTTCPRTTPCNRSAG